MTIYLIPGQAEFEHLYRREKHVEIVSAREYYGRRTPGTVVLVNGHPTHFTGKTHRADAGAFARKVA